MKSNKTLLMSLLFILLLSLGCAPVLAAPAVPNPYHMIFDSIGEPETIDPAWCYDTASASLIFNVYETLIFFNGPATDKFVPQLATEYTVSPDGLRFTFKLREGVKFTNGKTLTTEDVEYSFERWMVQDRDGGPQWMAYEPLLACYGADLTDPAAFGHKIDDAVQHNATHVWLNLVEPFPEMIVLQTFAQSWAGILNKEWCVAHGDWPGWEPTYTQWVNYHNPAISPLDEIPTYPGPTADAMCGTGPYKLDYWNKGVEWSIVKNDGYWAGWPAKHPVIGTARGYVTRYTETYMAEWTTRKLRFLAGDADLTVVPRMYIGDIFGATGVRCIYPLPTLACASAFFTFNLSTTSAHMGVPGGLPYGTFREDGIPPDIFMDLDVRKGFAYAFNYTGFLEAAYLGEAIQPTSCIVEGLAYYNPAQPKLVFDMAKAKEHLMKAWGGKLWANGFTMNILYNEGNIPRMTTCLMWKAALEALNPKFHLTVMAVPWGAVYLPAMVAGELPFFQIGWLADYPDPHNFVFPFMHSQGTFAEWQKYSNPHVDELIERGVRAPAAERQAIYYELQKIYVDEIPSIALTQAAGRHFERTWVQGWYYNPIYPGDYVYHLWKEELPREDADMNGAVNIVDIARTAKAFGSYYVKGAPHPRWDSRADLNNDLKVNIVDIATVAKKFGWKAPAWTPP